jgi:hypothetical protein
MKNDNSQVRNATDKTPSPNLEYYHPGFLLYPYLLQKPLQPIAILGLGSICRFGCCF